MENVCRTCLRIPNNLFSIFDQQLAAKIVAISDVQVTADDDLPSKVCEECIKNINFSYNFRKVIRNSDIEIRQRHAAICMEAHNDKKLEGAEEDKVDSGKIFSRVVENEEIASMSTSNNQQNIRKPLVYWKGAYKCKVCSFTCTDLVKLRKHRRVQHSSFGICSVCGKRMKTDNLNKHIRSHFEDPVKCPECGKVYKNSTSLRGHLLTHRGPELVCDQCGKIYKYRGEYNRHIKNHLKTRRTTECHVCNKTIIKESMKKHMRSHTGERPYECQYCDKRLSSTCALKTHIRQHTNEKPYICEFCSTAFHQKISLASHVKSKHSTK